MRFVTTFFALFLLNINLFAQEASDEGVIVNQIELIPFGTAPGGTSVSHTKYSNADAQDIMSIGNNVVQRSIDAGKSWTTVYQFSGWEMYNIAHPTPMVAIAVGDSGRIMRTKDGGATWDMQLSGSSTPLKHIVMYDALNGVIGHIPNGTLLITNDGGDTWNSAQIPQNILPPMFGIVNLTYPFKDYIIAQLQWKKENWILTSSDAGKKWSLKAMNLYPRFITALTKDTLFAGGFEKYNPSDPDDIRAYTQLVRSTNGGETWDYLINTVNPDFVGIHKVVFLNSTDGIAAGTSESFYFTHDRGETWLRDTSVKSKLENTPGNEGFGELTMLTSGLLLSRNAAGSLRIILNTPTSVVDNNLEFKNSVSIAPNPAIDYCRINLPLSTSSNVRVTLCDQTGRVVFSHNQQYEQGADFVFEIDTQLLSAGTYICHLEINGKPTTKKIIIVR